MKKLGGLIHLLRPINCLMMGGAVLIGELIAYENISLSFPTLLGFVTASTITGASMVANDYWDRFVDKINAPNRPIPSGLVSTKEAMAYTLLLAFTGLIAAFLTNLSCFIIAISALFFSMAYNFKGKEAGLIGNFMVSACVALPLVYGGFVYQERSWDYKGLSSLLFFTLMAFFSNTGREITKGITDVEGDRIRNVRSVAIRSGSKGAAVIAVSFYAFAVGLSVFPWLYGLVSWLYLPFVVIADFGFSISSFILLRDYSKENARRVKNMVLFWMVIALVAFVVGGLRIELF